MTTPTITGTSSGFARGINKTVCIVGETTFGQAPAGGAGVGQLLRRTSAVFNVQTTLIPSQEITVSQQTEDARQGPRTVTGTFSDQLSCGTFDVLWEALLRANFSAGASVTGITDLAVASTATANVYTLSSVAQNWTTSNFYAGDTIRLSGFTGGAAVNNGVNLDVLSSTVVSGTHILTVLAPASVNLVAVSNSSGQTVTVSVPGKRVYTPPSGQIIPSFAVEEYYADIGVSDVSTGCRLTQASFNFPAAGYATFQASFTGQNQVETNAQVYSAPNPESTSLGLTVVGGEVVYKDQPILYITSMSMQLASTVSADPVVGSNIVPDVFLGQLSAQGSFSAYFAADSMNADFLNEVEVDLCMILTDNNTNPSANFFKVYLPRVKLASQSKTDIDRAISRSFNFRALRNLTDATKLLTTVVIQDTLA